MMRMVTELFKPLQNKLESCNTHEPAHFRDPLALRTRWTAQTIGGSGIRTHRLVQVNPQRIALRSSLQMKGLLLVMLLIPSIVLAAIVFQLAVESLVESGIYILFSFKEIIGAAVCLLLILLVLYGLLISFSPTVFDKATNTFRLGRNSSPPLDYDKARKSCTLKDIHAVQLICIRNTVWTGEQSYYAYEVNLVLRNGERINICNHGDLSGSRSKARILAQFLGRPLWDAV